LHMGVLRDYLAFEFETSNVLGESPWDVEHTIDDFVFMTFFVGHDFLPHMPALDIGDNAFDLLFWTYKQCRKKWLERDPERPYLTDAGTIISGRRLEEFLSAVGSHEVDYYDKKKQSSHKENDRLRKEYKKWGMGANVPDEHLVASKEESDRVRYRKMLQKQASPTDAVNTNQFSPVMTGDFEPAAEEDLEEGLVSRMGNLLQNSLSQDHNNNKGDDATKLISVDDQDLKGRYYHDKFHFTPFDAEKHLALRKAYIEGLVWNLKYYYEGCVSWEWYFPFHYGKFVPSSVPSSKPMNISILILTFTFCQVPC
jgi:5'-3' exonuclease